MPIPHQTQIIKLQLRCPVEYHTMIVQQMQSLVPQVQWGSGTELVVISERKSNGIYTQVLLTGTGVNWEHHDHDILRAKFTETDWEHRIKERIRLGIMRVVCQMFHIPESPWGILMGVRPTKLVHRYVDKGFTLPEIRQLLREVYGVSEERQTLVLDVIQKQRGYFHAHPNSPVSIYIGIPFCPTRCGYCSFSAYPMTTHSHLLPDFFRALCHEIIEVGELLKELKIPIESVYLGGGTPTTIHGNQLIYLMKLINRYFATEGLKEFMVEAGRPETLTEATVQTLSQAGVGRISINPQSMQDKTLVRIGREHSALDVKRAFAKVRQAGIPVINSDIILGLPGEAEEDVEHTLVQLQQLEPDCLTVHSLAMKRAATWRKEMDQLDVAQTQGIAMSTLATQYASSMGMTPYYLYRQRYILSDLENIGYAKPRMESIYNIQMMEERQTIIGLGGGAITKLVSEGLGVYRLANPKCPATYGQQLEQFLVTKKSQIQQHLSV